MDKRMAERLAKRIERDDQAVSVAGVRRYAVGAYVVECQDTRNGIPFLVHNPEDWEERVKASEFGTKYSL